MRIFTDQTTWTNDPPHCRIGFRVKHMTISHIEGAFTDCLITIGPDESCSPDLVSTPDRPAVAIKLEAKTASIDTGMGARDDHLRSEGFFNVEKYPLLTFNSVSLRWVGDSFAKIYGYLSLCGVCKLIELDMIHYGVIEHEDGSRSAGFHIDGMVKRSEFELGSDFPENIISDNVQINVNIECVDKK